MIILGILTTIVQPYKSKKVNIYHSVLVLILALGSSLVTLESQEVVNAYWIHEVALCLITLISIFPTLNAVAYAIYYCIFHSCLKKCFVGRSLNHDLESLLGSHSRE